MCTEAVITVDLLQQILSYWHHFGYVLFSLSHGLNSECDWSTTESSSDSTCVPHFTCSQRSQNPETNQVGLWYLDLNFDYQESEVMLNYSAAKFWHYSMSWAHHLCTAQITIEESGANLPFWGNNVCFLKPQFISIAIKVVEVCLHRVWRHRRLLIGRG